MHELKYSNQLAEKSCQQFIFPFVKCTEGSSSKNYSEDFVGLNACTLYTNKNGTMEKCPGADPDFLFHSGA